MAWPHKTFVGVVLVSLLTAQGARAQTKEELEKARTVFKEGVALMSANNCPAALTKFRAVANVKMTAQVAFNIAECEERLGKLVSALGNYRVAASQAEGDPKSKEVASRVGGRIDALDARIPKLTIKRGRNADTASIEFDGSELGSSQLSNEFPVDPGSHTITAKVGGKQYLHETISLAEKETKTFEVKLDVAPPRLDKPDGNEIPPDTPPDQPPPPKGRSKAPGAVLLSLGIASGIVGGVMMGLRGGTLSDLNTKCGGDTTCPPSAEALANKGRVYTGVAEVMIPVGVVAVVTGIVLLATSGPPSKPKEPPKPPEGEGDKFSRRFEITPSSPGASMGGLSLVGRF